MLTQDQIELIHQEIDGANTPEQRAAFLSLVEQHPEARALAAELRAVALAFDRMGMREPPPRLQQAILACLPPPEGLRATWWDTIHDVWRRGTLFGGHMTRKAIIIGGTAAAAAVVILVAGIVTGFPPVFNHSGTIGGVEQAARYKGRAMTAADVTLQNPEIQTLFQNDQVLRLVQSDAFREIQQSAAYQQLKANAAFSALQANESFRQLEASAVYRQLEAIDAFRTVQAADAFRVLQATEAFRALSRSSDLSQSFMREAMSGAN